MAADVTDRDMMRRTIEMAHDKFGPINGVIHAAGLPDGRIIQLKGGPSASDVLAPKVHGTLVLEAVLREDNPDWIVLCSSLTSVLGGAGQVEYCAANAFLDAYAQAKNRRGGPLVVSINWDTWSDVGMAVTTPVPASLRAQRRGQLERGLSTPEGVGAFAAILANIVSPQIVVAKRDLGALGVEEPSRAVESRSNLEHRMAGDCAPLTMHARPQLCHPVVEPQTQLQRTIVAIWQELLGISPVGIHDHFFQELSGHSLMAMQAVSRLREQCGIEVSLRQFFECATIAKLAELVEMSAGGTAHEESGLIPVSRRARRADRDVDGTFNCDVDLEGLLE
jgi:acyl carrier protein